MNMKAVAKADSKNKSNKKGSENSEPFLLYIN